LFACANVENENETSKAKIIFNFHGVYRFLWGKLSVSNSLHCTQIWCICFTPF
jgi:hypothetical protein